MFIVVLDVKDERPPLDYLVGVFERVALYVPMLEGSIDCVVFNLLF